MPERTASLELHHLCQEIPGLEQLLREFQIGSATTKLYMLTSPEPAFLGCGRHRRSV